VCPKLRPSYAACATARSSEQLHSNLFFAARRLGFAASSKHTLTRADLIELTEHGYFPIVFVVSAPRASTPDVHSFVVVSATREHVEVLDPQHGPRSLDIDEFLESWSPMNNLAIVIA